MIEEMGSSKILIFVVILLRGGSRSRVRSSDKAKVEAEISRAC